MTFLGLEFFFHVTTPPEKFIKEDFDFYSSNIHKDVRICVCFCAIKAGQRFFPRYETGHKGSLRVMNPGEYTFTNFLEQIMRHDTAAEIHSAL
jgi:hypothetical protein